VRPEIEIEKGDQLETTLAKSKKLRGKGVESGGKERGVYMRRESGASCVVNDCLVLRFVSLVSS